MACLYTLATWVTLFTYSKRVKCFTLVSQWILLPSTFYFCACNQCYFVSHHDNLLINIHDIPSVNSTAFTQETKVAMIYIRGVMTLIGTWMLPHSRTHRCSFSTSIPTTCLSVYRIYRVSLEFKNVYNVMLSKG